MKIEATLGSPTEPGLYAARQWYAWRILEWHEGAWWHPGKAASWPANAEIEAYIGPLPVISKDYTRPPLAPHKWKDVPDERLTEEWDSIGPRSVADPMEYDL